MMESIRWKSDDGEMELFVSNGKVTIALETEDVKTYVSFSPDQAIKLADYIAKFAIEGYAEIAKARTGEGCERC